MALCNRGRKITSQTFSRCFSHVAYTICWIIHWTLKLHLYVATSLFSITKGVTSIACRNFPQGTISDMVKDASQGISFVCNKIAEYGGDPNR